MQHQHLHLPIYYMAQIKQQLDFWQLDSHQWLKQNHIQPSQLTNFEETIDYQTYVALITSAIEMSNNAALGLYIGERIGLTSHGMLGFALLNSSSIREAMTVLQEYINTRTPFISIELVENPQEFKIIFIENMTFDEVKQTFLEAVFVTFINILTQLTFGALTLSQVHFNFAKPHYAKKYTEFFSCPVDFQQHSNQIIFPTALLNIQLKLADPISLQQARHLCDAELAKMQTNKQNPKLSMRIKQMMLGEVGHFPSLDKTASRLHMTPRTLHRHLINEGTSYHLIVKEVAQTIASQYLSNTSMTVAEIALLLGYIDVANFRRAFKKWTGTTPHEFRKNNVD